MSRASQIIVGLVLFASVGVAAAVSLLVSGGGTGSAPGSFPALTLPPTTTVMSTEDSTSVSTPFPDSTGRDPGMTVTPAASPGARRPLGSPTAPEAAVPTATPAALGVRQLASGAG